MVKHVGYYLKGYEPSPTLNATPLRTQTYSQPNQKRFNLGNSN